MEVVIYEKFPSLNDYVDECRGHWSKGAKAKKKYTEICRCHFIGKQRFPGQVKINFQWHEGNEKRDPDNVSFGKKFILDGMVAAKIIEGDSPKFIKGLSETIEYGNDRKYWVKVTVSKYE